MLDSQELYLVDFYQELESDSKFKEEMAWLTALTETPLAINEWQEIVYLSDVDGQTCPWPAEDEF